MIDAVAVVVPVHDEEQLLGACLDALAKACQRLPARVECQVIVVLDACRDGSEAIAKRACMPCEYAIQSIDQRCVGEARRMGFEQALKQLAHHPRSSVWLLTTDADSEVPETWLIDHLQQAAQGAVGVAGSIWVDDWRERPSHVSSDFERFYALGEDDAHPHVHATNLGFRADAYLAVGGFSRVSTGEDHALWEALRCVGAKLIATRKIVVTTSSRLRARAPLGFAHFLSSFVRSVPM